MTGSTHQPNIWKDYDVLRCVECQGIMKVPKKNMTYRCPHCDREYKFEMVEEEDA